jgi:ATPase subunit of ABC transporter with duplicated ATPase domains
MRAINFNYASGVIINTCQTHGAWLDHHELERVEGSMEHWNRQKATHGAEWQKAAQGAGEEGSEKIRAIDSEIKEKLGVSKVLFRIFPFLNR